MLAFYLRRCYTCCVIVISYCRRVGYARSLGLYEGGEIVGKMKITDIVERELAEFLPENGMELFMTEYVKEGKDWYLRIYIDKEDGSVSIEDCEKVSGFIGKRLDELDPIEKNYFLEVSSPGLDRPLIKDSDYVKYKGKIIDITLYKALDGFKQYSGILQGLDGDDILIKDEQENEMRIPRELASKVRLAVIF